MSEATVNPSSSEAELWKPTASGVCVRLLSPAGFYSAGAAFRTQDAAIYLTPEICAVVTKFSPISHPDEYYYSEVEYLTAFEVRALSAPVLAKKHDTGALGLYPVHDCYRLADISLDLSKANVVKALVAGLCRPSDDEMYSAVIHRPPCQGGRAYDLGGYAEIDRRRLGRIYKMIDVQDHLLIRGLGSLLKGAMLICHREFTEHACMALWVSLDASFRLFLREMKKQGYVNLSAKDVGALLDDAFDNEYDSGGYFGDFYEERIKTMHPESRFGTYPAAPLNYDEYFQLEPSLRAVYEFLITGHIDKSLKQQ